MTGRTRIAAPRHSVLIHIRDNTMKSRFAKRILKSSRIGYSTWNSGVFTGRPVFYAAFGAWGENLSIPP